MDISNLRTSSSSFGPNDLLRSKADQSIGKLGLPTEFKHVKDELYQNSVMVPGSIVLATAYSDPKLPKGTGKDEAVIWVNAYGDGRVVNNLLGHDAAALGDPNVIAWLKRGVEWAGTGKVAATR